MPFWREETNSDRNHFFLLYLTLRYHARDIHFPIDENRVLGNKSLKTRWICWAYKCALNVSLCFKNSNRIAKYYIYSMESVLENYPYPHSEVVVVVVVMWYVNIFIHKCLFWFADSMIHSAFHVVLQEQTLILLFPHHIIFERQNIENLENNA